MMPSFDCFVSPATSELTLIVTGASTAPIVADADGERQVALRPAVIDGFGAVRIHNGGSRPTPGCWWGELSYDPARPRARLRAEIDGTSYRMSVATPEQLPPPKRRARRSRVAR